MRKNQSSLTATGIAIMRALESEKPEDERLFYDPYARKFVPGFLYYFTRFFDRIGHTEWRGPGVMGFLAGRERHIDEFLKARLADKLQQLVILGAGLDARAYRFEELKNGVKVFEVDHPASQQVKIEMVRRVLGQLPRHVSYVAVDFDRQELGERLKAEGYAQDQQTLFIWQGVVHYLAPAAVDSTLAFIAGHSGPGSAVIFDYMYSSLLDGTIKHGEVEKMHSDRWLAGEDLVLGIPEGSITEFLEKRGFANVQDADRTFLQHNYFTGKNSKRSVAYGYAIASAFVKKQPTGEYQYAG